MARTFSDATNTSITLGLGAGGSITGDVTLAAICRATADGTNIGLMRVGAAGTAGYGLRRRNTAVMRMYSAGNGQDSSTLSIAIADGWCLLGCSKTAGSARPRFYKYAYAAGTFTTENSNNNLASSTPVTDSAIGADGLGGNWDGDIAVAGAWASVLTDDQFLSLAFDLNAWFQVQPVGLWLLDQADTSMLVNDLTGNGANQTAITGTSVSTSSVPVFSYGHPIIIGDAGGTVHTLDVGGSITPTGALVKAIGKSTAGTVTPVGACTRATRKGLSGALTPDGSVTRAVGKGLSGSIIPDGTVAKSTAKSYAGSLTPAGTLTKATGKGLSGDLAPAGTLAKQIGKGLAGAITPSGALTKQISKALVGALTFVGDVILAPPIEHGRGRVRTAITVARARGGISVSQSRSEARPGGTIRTEAE